MDIIQPPEGQAAAFLKAFADAVDHGQKVVGDRGKATDILIDHLFNTNPKECL